jgi:hypothetical protein
MNTTSDRIDASKTCKKSKNSALIEEILFTEEIVGTQTIISVTRTVADPMEIGDIETMPINLGSRKTINRQTKMNNHLKTVKMISNQCNHNNLIL